MQLHVSCAAAASIITTEEAMSSSVNRQILLVEKPSGKLGPEHFKLSNAAVPEPKDGEALLRVRYISLDAANRAWMHGATYRSAVEANTVMAGGGVAEVVTSKAPGFTAGDLVWADTGWQEYVALPAKHLSKMPKLEPMTHLLSVYGVAGLTAYFGLLEVGKPKSGETIVVSAAAGSVGSIVGQIAKIKGCHVGGNILEACLPLMNNYGRIACCGAISQYDGVPSAHGPRGVPGLIVVKRLVMQGFIVMDFMAQRDKALADLQAWTSSGKLKVQEDVIDGLENTPKALIGLLAGDNRGKRMIKV